MQRLLIKSDPVSIWYVLILTFSLACMSVWMCICVCGSVCLCACLSCTCARLHMIHWSLFCHAWFPPTPWPHTSTELWPHTFLPCALILLLPLLYPFLSSLPLFLPLSLPLLCIYWCVKLFWDGGMDSSLKGWAEAWAFCSIIDWGCMCICPW